MVTKLITTIITLTDMAKKPELLVVTYLDDLPKDGKTPITFNQGKMNPNPIFQGVSVPQKRHQEYNQKELLAQAQEKVGDGMKLAIGYLEEDLRLTQSFIYDTNRFINEKIEKEEFPGYGKFWVFREKQTVNA